MPGPYRYSPCNNCCRTACDPGTTFIRVTVQDQCTNNGPLAGATVTVSNSTTGDVLGSAVTGSTGIVNIAVTIWTTYRITVSKTGYATNNSNLVAIGSTNCNATANRTVTLARNRIEALVCAASMFCGWEYNESTTGTISQAGSPSFTVNGETVRTGTDVGQAYFYFFSCYYLPGVPITLTVNSSGPYSPNPGIATFTSNAVCSTNESLDGQLAGTSFNWGGRGCPYVDPVFGGPVVNAGYVCSPWGQIPFTPPPNSSKSQCGKPYQVGNLNCNDPQVGGVSLIYKGCFGGTNPDGASYKGKTGLVWEGQTTYSSPGCTLSCTGVCTCTGGICWPGSFPATTATVNYLLYASTFANQWALDITAKFRTRFCGTAAPSPAQCTVSQFADDDYHDMTLNPPFGVIFSANNTASTGGFLSTATCPPGVVLEFNCGPFSPTSAIGEPEHPCEWGKGNRTVTVTQ